MIKEREDFKRENLEKLRDYIKSKERVSNNEIKEMLNISNATAERYLDELEKEELIKQVGHTSKYTHYVVTKIGLK